MIMEHKHEAASGRHRRVEYEGYLGEIIVYKQNSQCGGEGGGGGGKPVERESLLHTNKRNSAAGDSLYPTTTHN